MEIIGLEWVFLPFFQKKKLSPKNWRQNTLKCKKKSIVHVNADVYVGIFPGGDGFYFGHSLSDQS